jgi:hypothetical protein
LNFLTGDPDNKKPFIDDSLINLSNSPNPYMSGSDLIKAVFIWMGIRGGSGSPNLLARFR